MIVDMSNISYISGSYLLPSSNAPFWFVAQMLLIDVYVLEGAYIICDTFPVTWELKYLFFTDHYQTYIASSPHFWAFSSLPNIALSPLWSGGKVLAKNIVLGHITLYQESFIQEMFTMFQKGKLVSWPHIPLRYLTSFVPVAYYSTQSQLYTLMAITLGPDGNYTTSYLNFKYLIFRPLSPILPSQLFIQSSISSRPSIHGP